MGALRRLFTAVLGLLFLGIAAADIVALLSRGLADIAIDFLDRCFLYDLRQIFLEGQDLWLALVVGGIALVLGILILCAAFFVSHPPKQVVVKSLDGSTVSVSFNAIENVVNRAVASVKGVSDVHNRLSLHKDGLHIRTSLSLASDTTVAEAGTAVRQAISRHLGAIMDIQPADIVVSVARVIDNGNLPAEKPQPEPPAQVQSEEGGQNE